jgi:hypothetical protein
LERIFIGVNAGMASFIAGIVRFKNEIKKLEDWLHKRQIASPKFECALSAHPILKLFDFFLKTSNYCNK